MGSSRPSLWLKLLKVGLVAGALYDLAFAIQIAFFPELATTLLGLKPPEQPYFLWLIAVFLTMLALFYLAAAYDPSAYSFNILVAIVGRLAGAATLYAAGAGRPELWGLMPLAAGDLFFAIAHAVCWLPIRKTYGG